MIEISITERKLCVYNGIPYINKFKKGKPPEKGFDLSERRYQTIFGEFHPERSLKHKTVTTKIKGFLTRRKSTSGVLTAGMYWTRRSDRQSLTKSSLQPMRTARSVLPEEPIGSVPDFSG